VGTELVEIFVHWTLVTLHAQQGTHNLGHSAVVCSKQALSVCIRPIGYIRRFQPNFHVC
jgi:hypothetical protein